jgi:hypothetical protein
VRVVRVRICTPRERSVVGVDVMIITLGRFKAMGTALPLICAPFDSALMWPRVQRCPTVAVWRSFSCVMANRSGCAMVSRLGTRR